MENFIVIFFSTYIIARIFSQLKTFLMLKLMSTVVWWSNNGRRYLLNRNNVDERNESWWNLGLLCMMKSIWWIVTKDSHFTLCDENFKLFPFDRLTPSRFQFTCTTPDSGVTLMMNVSISIVILIFWMWHDVVEVLWKCHQNYLKSVTTWRKWDCVVVWKPLPLIWRTVENRNLKLKRCCMAQTWWKCGKMESRSHAFQNENADIKKISFWKYIPIFGCSWAF